MATTITDDFVSLGGAARIIGVTRHSILRAIVERRLAAKTIAGRVVVRLSSVERWRDELRSTPQSAA
jgi:hypothetical protein